MEKAKSLNIGKRLREYVKANRIFQSGWARTQGVKANTIAKYLKRESLQVETLFTICQVLKYNFIREIADKLPPDFPPHTPNPLQARITELEKENEKLKIEIKVLERMVVVRNS